MMDKFTTVMYGRNFEEDSKWREKSLLESNLDLVISQKLVKCTWLGGSR